MSRTHRRVPQDYHRDFHGRIKPPRQNWETARAYLGYPDRYFRFMPDGKRTWQVEVKRDNRATGLRWHKAHRRQCRQLLRTGEVEQLPAGKVRRYALSREDYRL